MYYDIIRKRIGKIGLVITESDWTQAIRAYDGEGKSIASVDTAYDCPEDNTVKRLGILDFTEKVARHSCSEVELGVNEAWDQLEAITVTDGLDTGDSYNVLIPIRYVVGQEVALYADLEGFGTPFAVDLSLDEDPIDIFNQHMLASGILNEGESYQKVEK